MFDPKLYREACRELRAPEDKIEEIIAMTEKTNKKRIRPLRTALICAAAVAMMVVGVSAANPEGVQEFIYEIMSAVQVNDYRTDLTTTDGEKVTVYSIPEAAVENRDGRAILTLDGEDIADITDVLKTEGYYTHESTSGESRLIVRVGGTAENWTIDLTVGDPEADGTVYKITKDSDGNETILTEKSEGKGMENIVITTSTYQSDGKTVTQK